MGAIVSIELLLDPETESAVRGEWAALAAAGLSSLAAHTADSNRPHITMLVRPTLPPLDEALIADLVDRMPLPVTLQEPILFGEGDRRILVRPVQLTTRLLELHASLHAGAPTPTASSDDARYTRPGDWTPHVTLARRLRTADIPRARELVRGELAGAVTGVRRWDAASATVTLLGQRPL